VKEAATTPQAAKAAEPRSLPAQSLWLRPGTLGFVAALSLTCWGALSQRATREKKVDFSKIAFKNWGISNPFKKSHVSATEAWKLSTGNRDVVVAVIDTGIDSTHPDLSPNLWRDPRAVAGQPQYGWDFVTQKPNPRDDHGHGTHVSGIIGATINPAKGVGGVAPEVSLMSLRYYAVGNSGSDNLRNTVKAINYAVDKGAKIINYSGGGPEFSEEEYFAIKRAEAAGVLFVSAAGNESKDTDKVENYYYPAAYRLSNIISVASTDINNVILRSSNQGAVRVDIAAPGENIFSTLPGAAYGNMTGTSQATAFVTGAAALLLAKNPKLTPAELKSLILESADLVPELRGKVANGARLNAHAALLRLLKLRPSSTPSLLARSPSELMRDLLSPAPAAAGN
jgi:subtilisin family serine protease